MACIKTVAVEVEVDQVRSDDGVQFLNVDAGEKYVMATSFTSANIFESRAALYVKNGHYVLISYANDEALPAMFRDGTWTLVWSA